MLAFSVGVAGPGVGAAQADRNKQARGITNKGSFKIRASEDGIKINLPGLPSP
jgi:hypothetical protein